MKKNMISEMAVLGVVFGLSGALANAAAPATTELCIAMTGTQYLSQQVLGSAQCDVTQTLSQTEMTSIWTCSFNGQAAQTLKTVATWVSDGSAEHAQTIFYDVYPQDDLGAYLFKGLNMNTITMDGTPLEIVLGATPHAMMSNLMIMTNGFSSVYDGLNINSVQNGSCSSQR
jgi:hypothetical protein